MKTIWLLLASIVHVFAHDELYILIDEVSLYNCRGGKLSSNLQKSYLGFSVKNEITINEEDVQIVNERGNRVYYIRAPGNYSLDFKKIKVKQNFGFLAGEIGITLQVPVLEGPAGIRFDLPYTMIPETTLLSQKCDEFSGVIERNGRTYCRYCDLCQVSQAVENELAAGRHQFLSRSENDTPVSKCYNIEANEYDFRRTIQLPSRSHLEGLIRSKAQGIDDEIKKRLNKGRGRFQVFLNLITSDKPAISRNRWMAGSKDCDCCFNRNAPHCDSLSYLYCNMEDCKTGWALQCLHNSAKVAACYTVEFNYRMTTSYADVLEFLRENNYPNQDSYFTQPNQPAVPTTRRPVKPSLEVRQANQLQMTQACVESMPARMTHLRRYCTIFWNEKLCCEHCPDIC
ncbi:Protein CBG23519 [Caenorhabditis briggsae]|uniref:Protein CBG23519 n=1 Tax=Caenorhabditis briggsae TaxID=6238 RepID=A8Y3Q6_CAEBR|nr:Protein CBG23519 [Caenorhabditis briggsae]CAP39525.2 Protein CBG23519 [Caenorhabditis briggsae]